MQRQKLRGAYCRSSLRYREPSWRQHWRVSRHDSTSRPGRAWPTANSTFAYLQAGKELEKQLQETSLALEQAHRGAAETFLTGGGSPRARGGRERSPELVVSRSDTDLTSPLNLDVGGQTQRCGSRGLRLKAKAKSISSKPPTGPPRSRKPWLGWRSSRVTGRSSVGS